MVRLVNIFVILTILTSCLSYNNLSLKDYIKSNDINVVLLISCESDNERFTIKTIEDLQHRGLWTNVWDISTEVVSTNFNYHRFFGRYSHPPCIVINLECNQTKAFLAEMSKRVFFHYERNWLMLSESLEQAFDILNQQNINFDAEIILTISAGQGYYDIYEVFNPSHSRGGRLNITRIGRWSEEIGWNIVKHTKIERRHDLSGITFPTVIPVIVDSMKLKIIMSKIILNIFLSKQTFRRVKHFWNISIQTKTYTWTA